MAAALRALDWQLGWFLDPLYFGRYPITLQRRFPEHLPAFTPSEADEIRGSLDFLGLSYFTAHFVEASLDEPDGFLVSDIDRWGRV
jgi:beta-glucosidase/6-phospho-beta-glucosidase/beta-galactosidase